MVSVRMGTPMSLRRHPAICGSCLSGVVRQVCDDDVGRDSEVTAPSWSKTTNLKCAVEGVKPLAEALGDRTLLMPYVADVSSQSFAIKEALAHVRARLRVLDLGCGTASTYDIFQQHGCEWIGADIADSGESIARTRSDCDVVLFDGVTLPFSDSSFDLIYCRQVFEHVRHPEALLREARRVLVSGGLLIGSTSHLEPFHSRSYWNFTPYGFATLLTDAGFSNVTVKPGIDGLTLILRKLSAKVKLSFLFSRFFEHESPVNAAIEVVGKLARISARSRAFFKLAVCGHFVFISSK